MFWVFWIMRTLLQLLGVAVVAQSNQRQYGQMDLAL